MTVFAHAGHWAAQIAYLLPLVVLIVLLVVGKVRERRERAHVQMDANDRKD